MYSSHFVKLHGESRHSPKDHRNRVIRMTGVQNAQHHLWLSQYFFDQFFLIIRHSIRPSSMLQYIRSVISALGLNFPSTIVPVNTSSTLVGFLSNMALANLVMCTFNRVSSKISLSKAVSGCSSSDDPIAFADNIENS